MDHASRRSALAATLIFGAMIGWATAIWAQSTGAPAAVEWGCDAPMGKTCYFSILSAQGAARSFSLPAGRRMRLGGFVVGRDEYLVSVDAPNLGDLNRCRQLIAMGHSCQRKAVDVGLND